MKKIALLLFVAFLCKNCFSQPSILWTKTYGGSSADYFDDIITTLDGGMICIGHTSSEDGDVDSTNSGSIDVWVVKLSESGDTLWSRTYGGSYNDYGATILAMPDSTYLLGCFVFSDDGDVTGFHGGDDIWLVKIDGNGNIIWQHCYGGSSGERLGGGYKEVISTNDGGFLVSARSQSDDGDVTLHYGSPLLEDIWVFKIDGSGNLQWQRTLGGFDQEYLACPISAGGDNYLILISTISSDGDMTGLTDYGLTDLLFIELDNSGNITDKASIGGSSYDKPNSIVGSPEGGYIITGTTSSTDAPFAPGFGFGSDQFAMKIDSVFNIKWVEQYGGIGGELPFASIQAPDGSVLVLGYVNYDSANNQITQVWGHNDYWCIRIDSSDGQLLWQESFGGSNADNGMGLCILQSDFLFLTGYAYSNDGQVIGNHGSIDAWLVALNNYTFISSIDQSSSEEINVFPNPFSTYSILSLTDHNDELKQILLYNNVGSCIREVNGTGYKATVDRNQLAAGLYFYTVETRNGNCYRGKILIQ